MYTPALLYEWDPHKAVAETACSSYKNSDCFFVQGFATVLSTMRCTLCVLFCCFVTQTSGFKFLRRVICATDVSWKPPSYCSFFVTSFDMSPLMASLLFSGVMFFFFLTARIFAISPSILLVRQQSSVPSMFMPESSYPFLDFLECDCNQHWDWDLSFFIRIFSSENWIETND